MKLADWLLLGFSLLLLVVITATIVRADQLTRTLPFSQWAKIARQCHTRIAAPPIANPDGTHQITFTGSAEDLACAVRLLGEPAKEATP